ncbi:MAG: hypothetical protein JSW27_21375 [Phycisphaerales bacterium]|nr:MAG: hypothetical protein JSW27_21375 [Phycisphaerales bacterium]
MKWLGRSTLALLLSAAGPAWGQVGQRGLYAVGLPPNPHPKQVARLEIATSPCPESTGTRWYRLRATKINDQALTVWFCADANPFRPGPSAAMTVHRYLLQEPNQPPTEYVDQRTGKALVPVFGFVEKLLPRTDYDGPPLFKKGTYLGQPLSLQKTLEPQDASPPPPVRTLVLRSDLIVGTSRNFRDDGTGRKDRKANYNFVPFTKANYEEMIAAGINYFTDKGEQVDWICHRPVFYDGYTEEVAFPEELYRPNFLGWRMFIDEPACRLAGKHPPGASLLDAVQMIHGHIQEKLNPTYYHDQIVQNGIDLGTLTLTEPVLPIWETYIETSYYQLEANPYGIVQECRWRIDPNADSEQILMLQRLNEAFGVDVEITPENLFLWSYSQMRGPARVFGSKWGMSIYGQAEPYLRLPSMKLAYDLGAEFIWFWTSDHDHHVPYTEQLRLARAITAYAQTRAPRDLAKLRRAAKTAIVIPYGYSLPTCWQLFTWGTHIYPLDRKNEHGLTYKEVLAPAVREIARCLNEGIAYDVLPAGKGFDPHGYERIFSVAEDGSTWERRHEHR